MRTKTRARKHNGLGLAPSFKKPKGGTVFKTEPKEEEAGPRSSRRQTRYGPSAPRSVQRAVRAHRRRPGVAALQCVGLAGGAGRRGGAHIPRRAPACSSRCNTGLVALALRCSPVLPYMTGCCHPNLCCLVLCREIRKYQQKGKDATRHLIPKAP